MKIRCGEFFPIPAGHISSYKWDMANFLLISIVSCWHQSCLLISVVNEVLLCTHNPILIKSLYGILRDEGFSVETADHSALAVQMVFRRKFRAVIIDSASFGLSADEAAQIIRSESPDIVVIFVGPAKPDSDVMSMKLPLDLEEFKRTMRDVRVFGALFHSL